MSKSDLDVQGNNSMIRFDKMRRTVAESREFLMRILTGFLRNGMNIPLWRDGRVVEGGGLENRCAKAPWVRILLPPPYNIILDCCNFGEMTELADGARLLSECGG